MEPTEGVLKVARSMFRPLWNHRLALGQTQAEALARQLAKLDRQVSQLLERIVEITVPSVIAAYKQRIPALEEEKLVLKGRMADISRPRSSFDETLRTALAFLTSPSCRRS